ncbi:MAG: PPC domain-containing DNA-binding protein [Pseudonocardiaceae bacterium]
MSASLPRYDTLHLVRSHELTVGRTFGLAFDHGDDFYTALTEFCRDNDVRQGYIPMFLAGFAEADLVGTCEKLTNPAAPVWSRVHLTNVDALGCGTLAYDEAGDTVLPHVHVAVGLKEHSATAYASHLLSARVQFLTEMLLVEVTAPRMSHLPDPDLYDVPLLRFGP